MKSNAVKELELDLFTQRYLGSSIPKYARAKQRYNDTTANGLTKCIIAFIKSKGGFAERHNVTGRIIDRRTTFTDVLGHKKTIGGYEWVRGSETIGSADIHATIKGRTIMIEVKIGKDKQSKAQMKYQQDIERAGGLYVIAHNFEEFKYWYNSKFGGQQYEKKNK
ncbi:MAG: hypothetical protein SPL06_02565 [Bacteroidales bacterium]|nr:hypothetical protein [Bacteroidales bacterium]MDY6423624.1 hypothetical protein [Bacteroidales bacterium]